MITVNKKSLASATIAATALAGIGISVAPAASASATANKTVTKSFTQTCQTVGPLGQRSFPSLVTVTLPTSVARGASFSTATKLKITVPASVNSAANTLGARSQKVTLNTVNVNTTKLATPTTDLTGAGSTTAPTVPVPANAATTLNFPLINTSSFKAGPTAGTATLKTGSISGTFQLFGVTGAPLGGPQPLSCAAQNVLVTTVSVA